MLTNTPAAVIGIWLIVSPWVLGFQDGVAPMTNAVVIGAALIATALGAIFYPRAWEEWIESGLGIWLVLSPWALGFGANQMARTNAVAAGIIVALLALWTVLTDKDYGAFARGSATQ